MVIPRVYDAFCRVSELKITEPRDRTRTTNMLLLGCGFLCAGGLLNVDSQLLFCLFFVHWSGGKMSFVAFDVEAGTRPSSV